MFILQQSFKSGRDTEVSSEGGGYIASTADLMIGLLFIFIILVVILALRAEAQDSSSDSEGSPSDPRRVLISTLGSGLTGLHPGIRIDSETGVISLPEEILFSSGSAVLTPAGKDFLQRTANDFGILLRCFVNNQRKRLSCNNNPQNHEVETVFIEGHTDSVPFASGTKDNIDLSLERARAVERILVSDTLKTFRNRSDQPIFSLSAYGDARPIKGRISTDAANRRVDLRFVMQYRSLEEIVKDSRLKIQNPLSQRQ
jgi:flagellar motor protein MotB